MSEYVDGFVIPIPKDGIEKYRLIAEKASKIWLGHGALEYRECIAEDLTAKDMVSFADLAKAAATETVVFAWITYQSRAHRDEVNAKVMADPRIQELTSDDCPFDCSRMAYGGFETIVKA